MLGGTLASASAGDYFAERLLGMSSPKQRWAFRSEERRKPSTGPFGASTSLTLVAAHVAATVRMGSSVGIARRQS